MYHVYPVNDLEEHLLKGTTCKCEPSVQIVEESGEIIVVHNSFDGREAVEMANDILGNN